MFQTITQPLAIEPAWYSSPINLRERKVGSFEIKHRFVENSTPIIGTRQALLRGVRPVMAKLQHPLLVHELRGKEGVWMTDLPEELFQIAEALATFKPKGRVLVGGLGLGILAASLAERPGVTEIVVVEKSASVIKLCATDKYRVVHDTIEHFLQVNEESFDCWMLDTWQMTNEMCWWGTVLPLRRGIRNKWGAKPKIWCWAEDIMQGQVIRHLLGPHKHWYYEKLPLPMTEISAKKFLSDIGLPQWEKRYGQLV